MKKETIFDFLTRRRESRNVAVEFENLRLSFLDLYELTLKTAGLFMKAGIRKGDSIALLLNNSPEFLLSVIASSLLCLRIIPLNTKLSKSQIISHLRDIKPEFLIVSTKTETDFPIKVVQLDLERIEKSPSVELSKIKKCEPSEPFLISTTSGSTSKPKPIVLSMETKIKRAFETVINLYGVKEGDTIVVSTPMYHTLGFRLSLIPIYTGCKAVIIDRFDPENWLKTVYDKKVNFAILVSSQIRNIMPYLKSINQELSSLRCLVSSSSSLSHTEKEELNKLLNCDIHEMYGTSETSTVSDINIKERPDKIQSVGYPLREVDIKIVDSEGRFLGPYEVGEIAVKTPLIFSGYLNMEEETKKSFLGDYFLTGDLGYLDQDGFLYYKGRKKFVYKVGAINVFPEDIEEVIMRYNGIRECAVVGVPHENESRLVAFYVSEGDIKESELRKFCFQNLASYQVPQKFIRLDEIPKNPVGKLDRLALEKLILERSL